MKFLITGCGSIGKRHLKNLKEIEAGELMLYRSSKKDREELEKEFNAVSYFDLKKGLEQKPDAVFVTNPTNLHIETAITAAKAGCNLFIEKPISHTLENVDELIRIAKEKTLVVFVAYVLRFFPAIQKMKELLDLERIGKVKSARISVQGYLPDWRPNTDYRKSYSSSKERGGGVILDLSHELDYARWFFGEAESLFCKASKESNLEITAEDTADITIQFKNNIRVEVHMDCVTKNGKRTCEIIGEKGTITWESKTNIVKINSESGMEEFTFANEYNKPYINEVKHFIKCLNKEETPLCGIEDAKKSLELALAAKNSADDKKKVNLK